MGRIIKAALILLIFGLLTAYVAASFYLKEMHDVRMGNIERNAALYDLKKEQLYRQVTSLQTVKTQLIAQLELQAQKAQKMQMTGRYLSGMPKPPSLNQTLPAGASLNTTQAPQTQVTPTQASQILEKMKKINQVSSKSSSSGSSSRKVTRAS